MEDVDNVVQYGDPQLGGPETQRNPIGDSDSDHSVVVGHRSRR